MWNARSNDLSEAVKILNLVGAKNGVPCSNFYKIEPVVDAPGFVSMSTTAGAVVEVQIEGSGKWLYKAPFYADRTKFDPFFVYPTEVKNPNQYVFSDDQGLKVKHGDRNAVFYPQSPVPGYMELPKGMKAAKLVLTKEAVELMSCAGTCAASELEAPHLACVYMQPVDSTTVRLLATNKMVVFSGVVKMETTIKDVLPFPLGMLDVVKANGLKSLKWTNELVVGKFPCGVVWQPVSELALQDFPVNEVIQAIEIHKKAELLVFQMFAYKFAKVMERLSYYLQSVRQQDRVLKITGKKGAGMLEIVSELPNVKFRETVEARVQKDFSLDWPLFMIESVMGFIGKESEKVALKVGLAKDGSKSYMKCGAIEMVIPSQAV